MRWSEGPRRLKVVVPGEGFGSTGLFEVKAGQVARQETPPMARLGSVEGRLDPKLAGPSTVVVLNNGGRRVAEATCDPGGRFTLSDVQPGSYYVRLLSHGRPAGALAEVRVAPGRSVAGLVIGPPPAAPARPARITPINIPGNTPGRPTGTDAVPILEGTVRDEQGRAVSGANVYARAAFDGGMRMAEWIDAATTDGQGRYLLRGRGCG